MERPSSVAPTEIFKKKTIYFISNIIYNYT